MQFKPTAILLKQCNNKSNLSAGKATRNLKKIIKRNENEKLKDETMYLHRPLLAEMRHHNIFSYSTNERIN